MSGARPGPVTLAQLLERVGQLPSLPATALALLRLADGAESSMAELARVVQQDQAVTVRVLRVANSAFYGVPGGVLTLQDALVVLGSGTLRALALTAALAPTLPAAVAACAPAGTPVPGAFQPAPFWRTALACAVLTHAFAESARVAPEIAFTAGLLHNIGVLAWCSVDPTSFAQMSALACAQESTLLAVSRAELGWDAFALGEGLARRWGLPASLCEVIGGLGVAQCHDHRHAQGELLTVLRLAMVLAEHLSISGVMVLSTLTDPATDAASVARRVDQPGAELPQGDLPHAEALLQGWLARACPQGSAAQMALQALALSPSQLLRCLRRAAQTAGTVEALIS